MSNIGAVGLVPEKFLSEWVNGYGKHDEESAELEVRSGTQGP